MFADVSTAKCKKSKKIVINIMRDSTKGGYSSLYDYQKKPMRSFMQPLHLRLCIRKRNFHLVSVNVHVVSTSRRHTKTTTSVCEITKNTRCRIFVITRSTTNHIHPQQQSGIFILKPIRPPALNKWFQDAKTFWMLNFLPKCNFFCCLVYFPKCQIVVYLIYFPKCQTIGCLIYGSAYGSHDWELVYS